MTRYFRIPIRPPDPVPVTQPGVSVEAVHWAGQCCRSREGGGEAEHGSA